MGQYIESAKLALLGSINGVDGNQTSHTFESPHI